MDKINLGDEVKHKYSGVKGIAVSRTTYLSGCDRISIQPKVKKDGSLGDAYSFDEPEIEIIKAKKVRKPQGKTGGWQPTVKHYLKF
jgi:hypothetical protein